MKAGRALVLAASANAAALLGCTALQNLQGTNTNKPAETPVAVASPTASATPIGAALASKFAPLDKRLEAKRAETRASVKETEEMWLERARAPQRAIDAITPEQERAVGQAAALNIIQNGGGLVLEEGLVRYVNAVANYVAINESRKAKTSDNRVRIRARRFFVGVLNDPAMNAYALPGGYILLTRGLVENLSCESDLAWVLGHEIAHVDNEHGLKALKLAVGGKEFLGQWTGTDKDSSLDNADFFSNVADKLANLTYKTGLDRDEELLADTQGLEASTNAGYDSLAAKRVLDLLDTHKERVRVFAISHDSPAVRLQALGPLVQKKPAGKLGIDRFDRGAIQRLEASGLTTAGRTP